MKVFVLEGSKGSYDDRVSWIEGVFSTMELLEEYKQKFFENNERIKSLPCPIDEEKYNQPQWYHHVTDEEYEICNEWEMKICKAKDLNEFAIREEEIDKQFKPEE